MGLRPTTGDENPLYSWGRAWNGKVVGALEISKPLWSLIGNARVEPLSVRRQSRRERW